MIFIALCFLSAYLMKKLDGGMAYLLSPVAAFISCFITVIGIFIFSGKEFSVGGIEWTAFILGTFKGTFFVCLGIWIFRRQDAAAEKKKAEASNDAGTPKT